MADSNDGDDDIPLLDEIVRAGREQAAQQESDDHSLSEQEIEAIASRVVERYTREMEQAVARAIRTALDAKKAQGSDRTGES